MRLTFIPAQTIKVAIATRPDLAQFIVGGIYIPPDSSVGRARLWIVNADLTDGGEIPFETESGKDDSVDVQILPTGDVRVVVSESTPGGDGKTAAPACYLIPAIFPPAPLPTSVDVAARKQANAATNMAHAANTQCALLRERIEMLEG